LDFKLRPAALWLHLVQLDKYYLDVVADDGGGCISYAAHLDGFGLAATVAATLRWQSDGAKSALQRRTLHGVLPGATRGGLTWRCPSLTAAGVWHARAPAGAETTLWGDARGAVVWQALVPRAEVELQLGQQTVSGWGYAERLRLNVAPWRLPIDRLCWGRFASAAHSVVWIVWEHATPRRWLWHNGTLFGHFTVADREVRWPSGHVVLGEPRPLRVGRLADTAFAHWPGLHYWIPRRLQLLDERKWCAPAALTAAASATTHGWVIHEHVYFR